MTLAQLQEIWSQQKSIIQFSVIITVNAAVDQRESCVMKSFINHRNSLRFVLCVDTDL